MEHTIVIDNLSTIDLAAEEFLRMVKGHDIIAFYGRMGAGKTTFTTAICRTLGVREDTVSSPTFAIVNEYRASTGESVYHFDFYRIEDPAEALDIGLYDYLDSGNLCILEWPENIEPLLPEETLRVRIEVCPDESRRISWVD